MSSWVRNARVIPYIDSAAASAGPLPPIIIQTGTRARAGASLRRAPAAPGRPVSPLSPQELSRQ